MSVRLRVTDQGKFSAVNVRLKPSETETESERFNFV